MPLDSAPSKTLTTQVESFAAARPELEVLFPHHWRELALDQDRIPLDVDWDKYAQLEKLGLLLFVTLRKRGELVGYYVGILSDHLHYKSTRFCVMDIYWTHPRIRGGVAGLILMRGVEKSAKARGASKIVAQSKNHRDSSRLFAALGYRPIETVHSKWIA